MYQNTQNQIVQDQENIDYYSNVAQNQNRISQVNYDLQLVQEEQERYLNKCNQWFIDNGVKNIQTGEIIRFETMLELESFIDYNNNKKRKIKDKWAKYGLVFGFVLGNFYFLNKRDQSQSGLKSSVIYTLSAASGLLLGHIPVYLQYFYKKIAKLNTNINFPQFEKFYKEQYERIRRIKKRLVQ
ncbi:hypothetical protein ABPG74_000724 [Tetrahymena malaccensis]